MRQPFAAETVRRPVAEPVPVTGPNVLRAGRPPVPEWCADVARRRGRGPIFVCRGGRVCAGLFVMITTQSLTVDDAQAIVDVLCAIDRSKHGAEDYRHDALEQARGEIPNSTTYLVCADDHPVARLRVVRRADYVEIAGVQVHPDWQSRGIGSAVITEIVDEGRAAGVPVELDVAKDNPDAERLYSRLGFIRVGEDDKDYRMRHGDGSVVN